MSRKRLIPLIAALFLAAIWLTYYWFENRYEPPTLAITDLDVNRRAGSLVTLQGKTKSRIAEPGDYSADPLDIELLHQTGWTDSKQGDSLLLGLLFKLSAKAVAQFLTTGNWIVALSGDGVYIFDDARRDENGSVHTVKWYVRSGSLRAKPTTGDKTMHWLEVFLPMARIVAQQAEIGLQVLESKRGRFWLVNGIAQIQWPSGRKQIVREKGIYDL